MKAKSLFITSIILFTFSFASFAQLRGRINIGLEPEFPNGRFRHNGVYIGTSVKYEDDIATVKNLNWTVSVGILDFISKITPNSSYHVGVIPIQAGVKYYFSERYHGFYGSMEGGFSILSYHSNMDGLPSPYKSKTAVSFAPGIGYQARHLDYSVRMQIVSTVSYLSLRVGYVINLNRGRKK